MREEIVFEIGQKYKNRKGTYKVIEIEGNSMTIRWKSGEEIVTTITMQRQIIEAMQIEYPKLVLDGDRAKRKDVKRYSGEPAKHNAAKK